MTFSTLHGWRYPTFLLHALTSVAVVGVHWRDVWVAAKMLPLGAFLRRVRISSFIPREKRGVLLLDDRMGHRIPCMRTVPLEKRYYSTPRTTGLFVFPYFAHPAFYEQGLAVLARRLSSQAGPRTRTLFFSGTVNAEGYEAAARFAVLTRPTIIDHLTRRLGEDRYSRLRDRTLLITIDDMADNVVKHRLSPAEYLAALAAADFCLCPPGCGMPHSHNIIEGMSVGAIPITNYAGFMSPPLRHGVDCLAFETLDEFDAILDSLSSIEPAEIERMRKGVVDYYLRHLDAASAGARFLENLLSVETVAINDETGR